MKKENKCILILNDGNYGYYYSTSKWVKNLINMGILIGFIDNEGNNRSINDIKNIIDL